MSFFIFKTIFNELVPLDSKSLIELQDTFVTSRILNVAPNLVRCDLKIWFLI